MTTIIIIFFVSLYILFFSLFKSMSGNTLTSITCSICNSVSMVTSLFVFFKNEITIIVICSALTVIISCILFLLLFFKLFPEYKPNILQNKLLYSIKIREDVSLGYAKLREEIKKEKKKGVC